ncbi:unnamed protein product [Pleuronectes platessa]|uniref:Uncharacterized protein n=1 Tax=Pleuronectes platessa TaxID=8262 RepID=A0A9N7VI30_PLEPL|nr:unnamed protein product [Pleuronectes platessa]
MPGSCHHHHGNASVLPVAITMAMGVSPSNHQHGPNVSLLTRITMAMCACRKHWATWDLAGGLFGADGAAVHPILPLNARHSTGSSAALSARDIIECRCPDTQ